ncbi:MAG: hypothetical protein JNJ50_00275 [Acidobacteria bacterium]|nr:hypothetical protein [Acidobacteriota bacterium]
MTPLPTSTPPELSAHSSTELKVGATVLDGDRSLEQFEANLPLAGVIAVDVRVANATGTIIPGGKLKYSLRDASGKTLKQLAAKKALKRVMKYYGDSFYAIAAYQRTLADYEALALPQSAPLNVQDERRGLLFFEAPRNSPNGRGFTLTVSGLKAPLDVQMP